MADLISVPRLIRANASSLPDVTDDLQMCGLRTRRIDISRKPSCHQRFADKFRQSGYYRAENRRSFDALAIKRAREGRVKKRGGLSY
jgi:hypothetical protein